MPRRSRADLRAVADAASAQDGLVTAAQLRAASMGMSTVAKRARTGGPWPRVLPAVYLVSGGAPDLQQRRRAALLYAGEEAQLTGVDALDLHGLGRPPEPSAHHVLVPHHRQRTSAGFAVVERSRRMPVAVTRNGLAVVPVARAVVDAARRMQRRDDVVALAARAVQRGFATVDQLCVEVEAAQIRGTALIRETVRELASGARSAPEAALRRAWLAAGMPPARWNVDLVHPTGQFIARPDVYLPQSGIAIEVDSKEFHFSAADWERTMRRHARMTAAGLVVLHFPPSRIRDAVDEVLRETAAAVATHGGRELPRIRIREGGVRTL